MQSARGLRGKLPGRSERVNAARHRGKVDGARRAQRDRREGVGLGDLWPARVDEGKKRIGICAGGGHGCRGCAADGHGDGGAQAQVAAEFRAHDGAGEFSRGPFEVDLEAAARLQAGDAAVRSGGGQGGQEMPPAGLALHAQFGDAGGIAEIAVDLERRMGVEQIAIQSAATEGPRSRTWRAASGPISSAQLTPKLRRFERFFTAFHLAIPSGDGGAVVHFVFDRFAHLVNEEGEAFELRIIGYGGRGAG